MNTTVRPRLYLWNACLGNFFEHYDTALFSVLSPFLAALIFPEQDYVTALILTYASLPLSMIARPVGALFFGYIGDLYGRAQALFLTLCGMSIVSLAISLTPTYAQIGTWAPLIFFIWRLLQNFLAAGETMGGAVFLLEHLPEYQQDVWSGYYNASTIGGFLLASLGVTILSNYQLLETYGWRLLYMFGTLTGLFGCLIRGALPSDLNNNLNSVRKRWQCGEALLECINIFRTHRKALIIIMFSSGFSYANYAVSLLLLNGWIPLISNYTKEYMVQLNTLLLVIDFCALPFFGWLASKYSRQKVMLAGSLGVVFCSIPLLMLLNGANLTLICFIRILFVLLGVAHTAPFYAWVQDLVSSRHRYLLLSFGYAVGSQLLGAPTAALSLWLFKQTGMIASIAWYWWILAVVNSYILMTQLASCSLNKSLIKNSK